MSVWFKTLPLRLFLAAVFILTPRAFLRGTLKYIIVKMAVSQDQREDAQWLHTGGAGAQN